MHRRDYALIARVIAESARTEQELQYWTECFTRALYYSPDNFNPNRFVEGINSSSAEVRASRGEKSSASSTEGRGASASELLNTSTGEVEQLDAPQHFADEHTPSDHFYRS